MSSLFAQRMNNLNEQNSLKVFEKLSSGLKINKAGDDASGLAVSEKMRSQIRGLNQASQNVMNGISFIQTTEGYLQETSEILQRIRELAVQSANGIYSDEDRMQIQVEVSQLIQEVDRIASSAQFNGMNLLTGKFEDESIKFHIGANIEQKIDVKIESATAKKLGLVDEQNNILTIKDSDSANIAIGILDESIKKVNSQRANLGAYQNRLEISKKGIDIAAENLTSSESRIRDTDLAKEYVELTKYNILQQSSMAMLAQANSKSEIIMNLLN